MPHQNGAAPDHRGDGGEAQSSVLGWLATATDSRPHNTRLQLVRADLVGADTAVAAGITATGQARRGERAMTAVAERRPRSDADDPTQLRFHPLADSGSSPILGVDPGITGGIAFLFANRVVAEDIPTAGGEVDVDTLVRRVREMQPALAIIERANAMPKQGVASTFKYGVAYGALRTVVALCNIPYRLVTPGKWKTTSASTATRKNRGRWQSNSGRAAGSSHGKKTTGEQRPR